MREIKFRAYDEQQKIMHLDFEFISSGQEHNDWIIFKSDKQQLKDKVVFDNPYFYKQFKIMQYTGLKDKNGVEIYEGDLLQSFYDDGEIHEVIWHEESASFRVATYLDNRHGGSFAELFFMDDIHENCNKIIGNIYENTELLE